MNEIPTSYDFKLIDHTQTNVGNDKAIVPFSFYERLFQNDQSQAVTVRFSRGGGGANITSIQLNDDSAI